MDKREMDEMRDNWMLDGMLDDWMDAWSYIYT